MLCEVISCVYINIAKMVGSLINNAKINLEILRHLVSRQSGRTTSYSNPILQLQTLTKELKHWG